MAETGGNPLALAELPGGGDTRPSWRAGSPSPTPAAVGAIEASFRRSSSPRRPPLLLVAAADPVGDPMLMWRAAERLGIGTQAVIPAAEAGLLEVGARVRFRHPLVRSAAYRAASLPGAPTVHRALAEVTDPELDPDRRAWHRAHATPGPDEEVAAELERSAARAQRGAWPRPPRSWSGRRS